MFVRVLNNEKKHRVLLINDATTPAADVEPVYPLFRFHDYAYAEKRQDETEEQFMSRVRADHVGFCEQPAYARFHLGSLAVWQHCLKHIGYDFSAPLRLRKWKTALGFSTAHDQPFYLAPHCGYNIKIPVGDDLCNISIDLPPDIVEGILDRVFSSESIYLYYHLHHGWHVSSPVNSPNKRSILVPVTEYHNHVLYRSFEPTVAVMRRRIPWDIGDDEAYDPYVLTNVYNVPLRSTVIAPPWPPQLVTEH